MDARILDILIKATCLLIVAELAHTLMRPRSAAARSLLWQLTICGLLILPVLIYALPSWELERVPSITTLVAGGAARVEAAAVPAVTAWILPLWMAGCVILLIRTLIGHIAAWQMTRNAVLVGEVGGTSIHASEHVASPFTFGPVRPGIVLPASFREWPQSQFDAVITHEQAHVSRMDCVFRLLSEIATSLYWFHPLVWRAGAHLRTDAERSCDDAVLNSGVRPSTYAELLLNLSHGPAPWTRAVMAMGSPVCMAARIRSILDAGTYRGSLTATMQRAGFCALLLIVVPLAITKGQGRIHSIQEAGVTAPQLLWKQEPQYSPTAKAAKLQGTVRVAVVIAENGTISDARVVKGLEAGLDANAVAALKTWKFQPATKAGKPVKVRANVEVNYRLL